MDPDSLFLMRVLGGSLGLVTGFLFPLIGIPIVLYVLARWRAARDAMPDSQIGLKFALHYFGSIGLQLALLGAALLLFTIISPGSTAKGEGYRAALALMVPAGLVLGAHYALLPRTNDLMFPNVRRLFAGYNLLVVGLVGLIALVFGFQALFAKGNTGVGHAALATVLVYCTAWGLLGWRLARLTLGDAPLASAALPVNVASPPDVATPAPGSGLPSLGGGSFPPIDR